MAGEEGDGGVRAGAFVSESTDSDNRGSRLISAVRLDTNVGIGSAGGVGHDRLVVFNRGFRAGEVYVAAGDGDTVRELLTGIRTRKVLAEIAETADELRKRLEVIEADGAGDITELEAILDGLAAITADARTAARKLEVDR